MQYETLFWEIIETLDKCGALPHLMIAGSWAEYIYSESLGDGVRAGFRTRDIDIVILNIRKPAEKLPMIDDGRPQTTIMNA
jgi:hypothetical protein